VSVRGAGELGLLQRIKPYIATQSGQDDAAVIADVTGFVVASCDMFVENVHFDFGWMSGEDIGWRSLALALGDLAAKGASPMWALTSVAMPERWTLDHLTGIYKGMADLARETDLLIVGGDMSSIEGPAVLSITVVGRTEVMPLARAQAEAGWAVGVTGPLGGAAVALRDRRAIRLRPKFDEGRRLNEAGLCCGDISDGLAREMEKFAAMAGVGCVLRAADVPRALDASTEDALASGEEAELVCVGPEELIERAGLRKVGMLTADRTIRILDVDGREMKIATTGYDHFA
jgi:thiamine-monophosphate kinase